MPSTELPNRLADGPQPWSAFLSVIMTETQVLRAGLHRAIAPARCDLDVRVPDDSAGTIRINGDCPCRDLVVDLLVEACRHLAAQATPVTNPPGAVRKHLQTRATGDWIRSRRLAMGAQARCDRIRTGDRARGLPDDFHRALLEYLVDEAGSPAPLDDHECLVRRLATRCAREFGGEPADHTNRVRDGIRVVELHCRGGSRVNAGTREQPDIVTWWERYIERPLGRRPRRATAELPDALSDALPGEPVGTASRFTPRTCVTPLHEPPDPASRCVVEQLVHTIRHHPGPPIAGLRAGLADLAATGLISRSIASAMVRDEHRMQVALHQLALLS